MLVVDLGQLEGRARAKALALGTRDIGVVELALQPASRGQRALATALDADFQLSVASSPGVRCFGVLAILVAL